MYVCHTLSNAYRHGLVGIVLTGQMGKRIGLEGRPRSPKCRPPQSADLTRKCRPNKTEFFLFLPLILVVVVCDLVRLGEA